jgi:hypothetical protein
MPRHLVQFTFAAFLAAILAVTAGCGDDDDNPTNGDGDETGSVAGTVTFQGTWPATGDVQVSIFSTLVTPPGVPGGPPEAFTDPLDSATDFPTYHYKLEGLDPGEYAAIFVGWRDPANPTGAKLIGTYWIYPDSVGIAMSGLPQPPGPSSITIDAGQDRTGLNIVADLDLAP